MENVHSNWTNRKREEGSSPQDEGGWKSLLLAVVAYWLKSQTCNPKVVGLSLGIAGIVGGESEWTALSSIFNNHDWGALEQGTKPPIAPRVQIVEISNCTTINSLLEFDPSSFCLLFLLNIETPIQYACFCML